MKAFCDDVGHYEMMFQIMRNGDFAVNGAKRYISGKDSTVNYVFRLDDGGIREKFASVVSGSTQGSSDCGKGQVCRELWRNLFSTGLAQRDT